MTHTETLHELKQDLKVRLAAGLARHVGFEVNHKQMALVLLLCSALAKICSEEASLLQASLGRPRQCLCARSFP